MDAERTSLKDSSSGIEAVAVLEAPPRTQIPIHRRTKTLTLIVAEVRR